jgi:hypothetical protein
MVNTKSTERYRIFDTAWFDKNQDRLLWLLNSPLVSHWFRWVMGIDMTEHIDHIAPNHITTIRRITSHNAHLTKRFRTHDKYSKRLYYAFKPIWWAMHIADLLIDPLVPSLSFGFSTLTVRPSAGTSSPADGTLKRGPEGTWAAAQGASTAAAVNMSDVDFLATTALDTGSYYVYRSIACFDTSAVGSGATIQTTSKIRLYDKNDKNSGGTCHLLKASPSSPSSFATSDFVNVGTVKAFVAITVSASNSNTYNDYLMTDTTIVNPTGITYVGLRDKERDIDNVADTTKHQIAYAGADTAGTSQDPELVINYVVALNAVRSMFLSQAVKRSSSY